MLLDILIPTYKRPDRALDTIKPLLLLADTRFRIICSSNRYEPDLECLRKIDPRVSYNYFEENIGPVANIKYLISISSAQYSMYLSDEDALDATEFILFLDFLETLDENQSVVLCSVFDPPTDEFFFKIPRFLAGKSLDLGSALSLHILPHYLSGYIFRRNLVRDWHLEKYYTNSRGGVYPMLYLAIELLKEGRLGFYSKKMVLRGPAKVIKDDNFYDKKVSDMGAGQGEESGTKTYYNPYIYSASAFVRQFFFAEKQLFILKPFISRIDYFLASMNRFLHMYITISLADKVFRNTVQSIPLDCEKAFKEALYNKEVSGSLCSKLFRKSFVFPVSIGYYLAKFISINLKIAKFTLVNWRVFRHR